MAADFARPFVPERVTQLYHAAAYALLGEEQRLRYNQLYAAHINEQFAYFERSIGNPISASLLRVLQRSGQAELAVRVAGMMEDEERHRRMFDGFNRSVFPDFYAGTAHRFIRPSPLARLAGGVVARFAARLPFTVWVALFFEEFSVYLSRTLLSEAEGGAALEPSFVGLHRRHLEDEERHVRLYPELIRAVVTGLSPRRRRLQGALLKRVMRELLAPKRSGVAVVRQLASEFPALRRHEPALVAAVRGLKDSPAFFNDLFGPSRLPVMHAMFREFPEFSWRGYHD